MTDSIDAETVVVLNPVSGNGDHVDRVRERARAHGYGVRETEHGGHAVTLARTAAEAGADRIVAAGGDGTLNEVIRGVSSADALDHVAVGVVPVGTGNNFAKNIGIGDVETAFAVLDGGEVRRLDLGWADGRPFVNSCVGGLTADASAETSSDLKARLGVLAYVFTTLRMVPNYEGIQLAVDVWEGEDRDPVWSGSAVCVLVGNGRRFPRPGGQQANMEDGLLDVAIVEHTSSLELVRDRITGGLFGRDPEDSAVARFLASSIELTVRDRRPVGFSLDGEITEYESLRLDVEPGSLGMGVGPGYEPAPNTE